MSKRGENIYKRKDGRWEGRILKPDGCYKSVYGKSYKEVKEKKNSLAGNERIIEKCKGVRTGSTALFEEWLANCARDCQKRSTYDNYYYCIHKYVLAFFEKTGADRITEFQIRRFVQSVNVNGQISASYKRKILTIFKTALSDILKKTEIDKSVLNAVQLPQTDYDVLKIFSVQEQRLIESQIREQTDYRAYGILFCFYTGIRLGELCALKWENIDMDSKIMTVAGTVSRIKNPDPCSGSKTSLIVSTPKSKSSFRRIPIPDFIMEILKSFSCGSSKGHFIFTCSNKPADPRTIQRIYKKILQNSGVRDCKFHAIRHTFATRALEMGVDIKTLSEIMGHSNVSVTLNIYVHSMLEHKKIAIEKMNTMYVTHIGLFSSAVRNPVSQVYLPEKMSG